MVVKTARLLDDDTGPPTLARRENADQFEHISSVAAGAGVMPARHVWVRSHPAVRVAAIDEGHHSGLLNLQVLRLHAEVRDDDRVVLVGFVLVHFSDGLR